MSEKQKINAPTITSGQLHWQCLSHSISSPHVKLQRIMHGVKENVSTVAVITNNVNIRILMITKFIFLNEKNIINKNIKHEIIVCFDFV